MCLEPSTELSQLDSWLNILISTYKEHPSCSLAKAINDYLNRLLTHDDISFCSDKRCDYLLMQRFWRWQASRPLVAHS